MSGGRTLIVITGATASGKTDLAVNVASRLGCEIISADSRQVYADIPIATAAPSPAQLAAVKHHLVGMLPLEATYSAARFDSDVRALLPRLWARSDYAVMCGGSMMYVDAFVRGLDDLPDVHPDIRRQVWELYYTGGLPALHAELRRLDPAYLERADPSNYKRLVHAVEVSMQAGRPYSSLLTGRRREHPFRIVKLAIGLEREELTRRIKSRTRAMMESGLEEEARRVYGSRHLNSLNTVGLKEMFAMIDGRMTRAEAMAKIITNTRTYAKKQLTWLRRNADTTFIDPSGALDRAMSIICES